MSIARASVLLCVLAAWPMASQAQSWDNSGNSLLNGTYYFRQVIYVPQDQLGDVYEAISIYGNITFNGNGSYFISNAIVNDSSNGLDPLPCYLANSACVSFFRNRARDLFHRGQRLWIFQQSDREYHNIRHQSGRRPGLRTGIERHPDCQQHGDRLQLQRPFHRRACRLRLAGLPGCVHDGRLFPRRQRNERGGRVLSDQFEWRGQSRDGEHHGLLWRRRTATISQSSSNVTYKANNGAAIVTFPTSTTANFYSGQVYLYFSPDGKFCFGGSPNGWDMLVGVRNDSSGFNSGAIYYAAGLDLDTSTLASTGAATFDSFYGSFSSTNGSIIEADRLLYPGFAPSVATFGDSTSDTAFAQYAFGNAGAVRVGAGKGPYLGLSVALQAPKSPGSAGQTVYLDPTSLQNTASYAPFTAGVSPGELITLYGANLAAGTVVAPPADSPPIWAACR